MLESLRGLLALWVVIGHTLQYCGFSREHLGPLGFLAYPGLAVDDFIILSGFVIFYLLDHQPLSYSSFLNRRFFRLAPLYFVVLLISALTLDMQSDLLRVIPWDSIEVSNHLALNHGTTANFFTHLVAHLTMLHGLMDGSILRGSSYAFVLQAWSISVEWQFYIVAPVLFLAILRGRWTLLSALLAILCVVYWTGYGDDGFAINRAAYFIIGIASFHAYRKLETVQIPRHGVIDLAVVAAVACLYMLLAKPLALIIWAVVFGAIVAQHQGSKTMAQRAMQAVLENRHLLWLGQISYSIYMVHLLLFFAVTALVLGFTQDRIVFTLVALPLTVGATVMVSAISYRWIERPGMALGNAAGRTTWFAGSSLKPPV